uniref:Uncharacterized protein n=1 Tax=Parascaris equorum TaxID=6256 RepID=A0A914SAV4_PAREQ
MLPFEHLHSLFSFQEHVPSAYTSFFQMGTRRLSSSSASSVARIASVRCGALVAIATDASPTLTTPANDCV